MRFFFNFHTVSMKITLESVQVRQHEQSSTILWCVLYKSLS